jgi:diguanylate cyclase (GGDEF)-like protein
MQNAEMDTTRLEMEELTRAAQENLGFDHAVAGSLAERGRSLAERLGDASALARNLFILGSVRLAEPDYQAAEAQLGRAADLAREAEEPALAIDALRGLLKCAFLSRRPEEALTRGMQALELAREGGDEVREAAAHNDLGSVFGSLGDLEGALRHLLAGLQIHRAAGRDPGPSLLNNIGNVYLELGDHHQALGFFRGALAGFRAQRSWRGEAIALGNVGRAQTGLADHEEALVALRASAELYESHGDEVYLTPALARLGGAYAASGDRESARACFRRSVHALESGARLEFHDEVLLALGRFHLECDEVEAAADALARGLAKLPGDESSRRAFELHCTLAEAHERRGDLAVALHHFKAFHRIQQAVADSAATVRIRGLMLQFDVERARQQEEISRLRNVELARAYETLQALHEQVESQNRALQRISIEDALTGLHNRRYLDLQLPNEVSRARRRRRPLCVAMCDLDHFKQVNDQFSHAVGDEVLRQVARIFGQTLRQDDFVFRYGGEEFLLLLPETDLTGAETLAQRIRTAIAAHPWAELHPQLRVTLSFGLAQLRPGGDEAGLIAAADARLYEAKRRGRDRVCL